MYEKLMQWLTKDRFGEYNAIHFLFGEKIARRLSKEQQFHAPVV